MSGGVVNLLLLAWAAFLLQTGLAEDCSWTEAERTLDCCPGGVEGEMPEAELTACANKLNYHLPEVPVDTFDPCAEECYYEGLTTDGHVDWDKILEDESKGTEKNHELRVEAVKHCIKEKDSWKPETGKCASGALSASYCIDTYLYMHCANWRDTAECNATREKMTRCKEHMLMQPTAMSLVPPQH